MRPGAARPGGNVRTSSARRAQDDGTLHQLDVQLVASPDAELPADGLGQSEPAAMFNRTLGIGWARGWELREGLDYWR